MKRIIFLLAAFFTVDGVPVFAQHFEVPDGYSFKNKTECARYEQDIIAASKWLFATPMEEQQQKWKQVAGFVAAWVQASPVVNAEMNEAVMEFETRNPGMMVLYFAGCSLYVLENNYSPDIRAKHRAALLSMMEFYKAGKAIRKDKKMKALIRQAEEGRLDEWIKEHIPVRD